MDQDRALQPGLRLELGEQAVDVMDIPGALDLGDHDDLKQLADLGDQRGQVIEHPGALQRVDPGPQRRLAEVRLLRGLDQPSPRCLLAIDGDRVLEVAEQDVGLLGDLGRLGDHLLVGEVEEVDHPRGLDRDLAQRLRCADRQRVKEVSGVSQGAPLLVSLGLGRNLVNRLRRWAAGASAYPRPRFRAMEAPERDNTQDWLLPEAAMPPTVGELEDRIAEAVTISRACEAAVISVGAAALEAANQANRAAEIAERASAVALDARQRVAQSASGPQTVPDEGSLRGFTERADRVVARLRALGRLPTPSRPANGAAARQRSAR